MVQKKTAKRLARKATTAPKARTMMAQHARLRERKEIGNESEQKSRLHLLRTKGKDAYRSYQ